MTEDNGYFLIMQLPVQLQMASPAAKKWLQMRRDNEVQPWTLFVDTSKFKARYLVERLRKYEHTGFPSIRQGPWTPWTHQHPAVNTVTFPAEELSAAPPEVTGTTQLLELCEQLMEDTSG
ncbi:uncharacterized protein LOC143030370 [Oratosquilla oratoria]|uniref:uncharacterized protein LOC143030370 n=1 Tax=Oratosquilla oratoria TaxID=337810 RepID=UPI003F76D058